MFRFEMKKLLKQRISLLFIILLGVILSSSDSIAVPLTGNYGNTIFEYKIMNSETNCNQWDWFSQPDLQIKACNAAINRDFQTFIEYKRDIAELAMEESYTLSYVYDNYIGFTYLDYIAEKNISVSKSADGSIEEKDMNLTLGGTSFNYYLQSIFDNSFLIIPLFIIIFICLFTNVHDKAMLSFSPSVFKVVLYKILASGLYSFIGIAIASLGAYLYYGFTTSFTDLNMPYLISLGKTYTSYGRPMVKAVPGYIFMALILLFQLLYCIFLSSIAHTIYLFLKNKFLVIASAAAGIIIMYYCQFQFYFNAAWNHINPFTYGNPIIALFGLINIFEYKKMNRDYAPYLSSKGIMMYNRNMGIYLVNGALVLIIATVIIWIVAKYIVKKRDITV